MADKKSGRPKSDNPKNIQMRIRLNKDEATMLQSCAELLGKTKSEVVIMGIEKVYQYVKK